MEILSVDLERVVPERLKPRTIEIGAMVTKGIEKRTSMQRSPRSKRADQV